MSSGTFGGTDLKTLADEILSLPVIKVVRTVVAKKKSWRRIFKKKK